MKENVMVIYQTVSNKLHASHLYRRQVGLQYDRLLDQV